MSAVTYDVTYTEERNRLTNAFRLILAIPHFIVMGVWRTFAQILAVVQWFIVVFTGKRNQGIFDLQNQYLAYATRVTTYASLQFDAYPPFGTAAGDTGVTYELAHDEPASRLTNGLRFIWAIPALVIMIGLIIFGAVIVFVSWFVILFTGTQPRNLFDWLIKVNRYAARTNSYVFLMTDTYPKYE